MKRIAVVGGGISGLSAAFALEQRRRSGCPVEYVLFESAERLGGVLLTERVEQYLVEAGPDSFLTEKSWASDFCLELGLGEELIRSHDAQRKTYIVHNRRLVPIPDGLAFLVPTRAVPVAMSPLFSLRTKVKMALELLHPKTCSAQDESVASLIARHYGPELVERLADPLLAGIYGGEASQLSVRAVLGRFAAFEADFGSLGRGMLAERRRTGSRGPSQPGLFTTLRGGMQQLVDALAAQLSPSSVQLGAAVQSLRQQRDGWSITARSSAAYFDGVILAVPGHCAAALLASTSRALAAELGGLHYGSSLTVALAYDAEVRASLPSGFGFLVPRSEGKHMLAATFVHNKFAHRCPDGHALLRCFLGGTRDEAVLELADRDILRIVSRELNEILGIRAAPLFTRIYRWKQAMVQYSVGHLETVERIARYRRPYPSVALAGNAYRGIGIPDCIRSGQQAAAELLESTGLGVQDRMPGAGSPA
jgi:oxygen-dependent protoporphyrinogen oxidase